MTNTSNENIKLRKDGSIDTNFYMTRGRYVRSQQAHNMSGAAFRSVSKSVGSILKAVLKILGKNEHQMVRYPAE